MSIPICAWDAKKSCHQYETMPRVRGLCWSQQLPCCSTDPPTVTVASTRGGSAGWEAKKLFSLMSTLWAIWTNLSLNTYFILVKQTPASSCNCELESYFLLKMVVVGKEIKVSLGWSSTGCSRKSKHCSLFLFSTQSLKENAGIDYATQLVSSW